MFELIMAFIKACWLADHEANLGTTNYEAHYEHAVEILWEMAKINTVDIRHYASLLTDKGTLGNIYGSMLQELADRYEELPEEAWGAHI